MAQQQSGHVGSAGHALGLVTFPVGALDDDWVAKVLGLEGDEAPLYLLPVGRW